MTYKNFPTNNSVKPDFLCIGAKKVATTRLYAILNAHSQVNMPPIKELDYFNNQSFSFWNLLFPRNWLDRKMKDRLTARLPGLLLPTQKNEANWRSWYYLYFFGRRSLRWYQSLFPAGERLSGDLSINYALLQASVIAQIAMALSHLKILYILRNPIDRDWANAKYSLPKQTRRSNAPAV